MNDTSSKKVDRSRAVIWGLTALFAAGSYAGLADLEVVPDGEFFAGKENVYVEQSMHFVHNGMPEESGVIVARPLEKDHVKPGVQIYFNETGSDLNPGMYRLTTRANLFRFLEMGPAMVVKAEPLI